MFPDLIKLEKLPDKKYLLSMKVFDHAACEYTLSAFDIGYALANFTDNTEWCGEDTFELKSQDKKVLLRFTVSENKKDIYNVSLTDFALLKSQFRALEKVV